MDKDGTGKLAAVAAALRRPRVQTVTIRTLLGWYGWERRSYGQLSRIKRDLDENGLYALPDFAQRVSSSNHAYRYRLDDRIALRLKHR